MLSVTLSHSCVTVLSQARGEPYRPPSSLSAPVTRFDGRPRARDRPKPRRRPRPKEPEETRRSRSAPATGAPTTPQPPSHTAQNEGFLYRKKATSSDLEAQQRSPNRYSHLWQITQWMQPILQLTVDERGALTKQYSAFKEFGGWYLF